MHENTDFNSFLQLANAPVLGNNLLNADNLEISEDEALLLASDLWREVMNNYDQRSDDCLVSFEDFMTYLKMKDKDFSFEILRNTKGEVTGCLWMTSTMRKNFELFGGSISVDAMKRDINTMIWPYISIK